MRKIKKKCCVCGKEYEIYCPTCREAINQPIWMNSFCSSNCRGIYNACSSFNINAYTKDEAKTLLDMCDLSDKEHFTPATQRLIKEIYEEVEKEAVVDTVDEKKEESVQASTYNTIKKVNYSKKNKRK